MNNEEKILTILETMQTDMKDVKTDISDIKTRLTSVETKVGNLETKVGSLETKVGSLDTKVGNLETDMQTVKREVVKTNLTIENEIAKSIRLIAEVQKGLYEKVSDWKQEYDEMAATVLALDTLHIKK